MTGGQTTQIESLVARLRAGDRSVRDQLIACAQDRLTRLARKMLKDYPAVRSKEGTCDIFQNAAIRLCRALDAKAPQSARHFFNLATVQIRRELIDLARQYSGPRGGAANQERLPDGVDPSSSTFDPNRLANWTEFHQKVEKLPDKLRETFELIFYQNLRHTEAAELLEISVKTIQRRWHAACHELHDSLGELPH